MKKYLVSIIALVVGIGCLIAYNAIGSSVAPDGRLVEPFFLVPIGSLCLAVGVILTLVISTVSLFRQPTKTDKWVFGLVLGAIVAFVAYVVGANSLV